MTKVVKNAIRDAERDLFRQAVADARPCRHGKVLRRQDAHLPTRCNRIWMSMRRSRKA